MGVYDDILRRIMQNESSGVANAQNPKSSAGGLYQFTDPTWAGVLRNMDPSKYGSMDSKALAALKFNPELNQAAAGYHMENNVAPTLQKAGFDVTPANAYLSWFQGPQGAVQALKADPSTKVSELFPKTIDANSAMKFNGKGYADWSVGDLKDWASSKMGGAAPVAPAAAPNPSTGLLGLFGGSTPSPKTPTEMVQNINDNGLFGKIASAVGSPIQTQMATDPAAQALQAQQAQSSYNQGAGGLASLGSLLMQAGQGQQAKPVHFEPFRRPQQFAGFSFLG